MSTTEITWEGLIRLLDPQQPIPKRAKAKGAIEFWREWDAGRQRAVWGKRYIANDEHDLRAFNSAEIEWLMQLSSANIGSTYRRASLEQEGTRLAQPASTTIKTFDCGPTLDDWLHTTVSLGGRQQAHCFVQPESFLRMAQGVLLALERVHACHFIHCDLHPGNITLPMKLLGVSADQARLFPCWDDITLIDFGYSIDARRPPKTTLPIRHEGEGVRISPHLQSIMSEVELLAKALRSSGELWENVRFDPAWWLRLQDSPLKAFTRLDWREDLYQFGRTLADIRDGVGNAEHLDGRTIRQSKTVKAIDQMVNELPEQLMQWGLSPEKPAQRPHLSIVQSIQSLLIQSMSTGAACPNEFALHKAAFGSTNKDSSLAEPNPTDRKAPQPPVQRAAETVLSKDRQAASPPCAKFARDLSLPAMQPLRVAAPAGWQFLVARTPVTWRQWQAACQINPDLYRPGALAKSGDPPGAWLDTAVTHVSHADCMAYIHTINHLSGAHAVDELALFRLPTAAEWALLAAGAADESTPTPGQDIQHITVNAWAPNAHGLAGVQRHLWQWQAAPEGAGWAHVRGGCAVQTPTSGKPDRDPVDQYPIHYRSPFITLRLVRHVPVAGTV